MDILKALKRTTYLSAAALLAFGATDAQATDTVAYAGHISASVQGTLAVTEINAINFGNFAATGCGTTAPVAGVAGTDSITLSDKGARTVAGSCFTLMNGASGKVGQNETGGQTPGFYSISNGDSVTNVYVSFADGATGDIIDSTYGAQGTGSAVYTHPNNYLKLTGTTANAFAVNEFSFETDDPAGPNGTSGYVPLHAAAWDAANSGEYVACGASCTLRVGAKLTPLVAIPAPGKYTGTFYIMVSY
jgi:hypothetical protein